MANNVSNIVEPREDPKCIKVDMETCKGNHTDLKLIIDFGDSKMKAWYTANAYAFRDTDIFREWRDLLRCQVLFRCA